MLYIPECHPLFHPPPMFHVISSPMFHLPCFISHVSSPMFPPPPPVFSLLPLFFSSFFFLLSKMMALRQRKAPVLYGLDDENDGTWDEDHYATTSTGKAKPSRTILTRISSAVRDNFSQFSSNFSYNFSYSFLSLSLLMMTSSRAGAGKRSWFWLESSLWPSWSNWIIWRVQTKSCALLFFSSFSFGG